jgi:chemotaxis regulatin CheY-phosphate phosphatase CheZ
MTSTRFDELIGSLRFALDASTARATEMPAQALDRCEWYSVKLMIARSRTYDAVTEAERLQGEYDALLAALRDLLAAWPYMETNETRAARAAIAATEIPS